MGKSMTGIGEARITKDGFDIHVLIRSVNHRFLNLQVRTPRGYHTCESHVRDVVSKRVRRGKVDVYLDFYELPESGGMLILNRGLCRSYHKLAAEIADSLDIPTGLTAERLLRFNDVVSTSSTVVDDEKVLSILEDVMNRALDQLDTMRRSEGQRLVEDMKKHLHHIISLEPRLRMLASRQPEIIRQRLKNSIQNLMDTIDIDPDRLEQEVLMWAVKADITEEITRLNSHLERLASVLDGDGLTGKASDFLLQEIHREINTIGSKSALGEINELIVTMKMDVEKLREQAQNLE